MDKLKFKKLKEDAILPTRGSEHAAGLDLYARENAIVLPNKVAPVSTGLATAIPVGYYGRVAPRSGLAIKNGIDTLAGVVDSDYRGEVNVILANHTECGFEVQKGDRIAQLIIEKIETPTPEWAEELDDTARGASGFGSTGA